MEWKGLMMPNNSRITVTSNVARDFLQNSAYFGSMPKVVWEYVSNSLDNATDKEPVTVAADISKDAVSIADNGSGMSRADLQAFFQMHGVNRQRQRGKRVRGRFGTGKCAAFGLANTLTIDTVHSGRRNRVELTRADIEAARDGQPFPVRDVVVDTKTDAPNGTRVIITDLLIRRPDIESTIKYVERHLSRYRQRAKVFINTHECQFDEPLANEVIERHPHDRLRAEIGDVILFVKVSPIPLELENNGIDILSNGIWHQTTLAGAAGREMSQYIFGEIDIPALEDREWPIPPFDNTRNGTLNVNSPVVVMLFAWLTEEIEAVRKRLTDQDRARKSSEEAKRLQQDAAVIAKILNDDFERQQMELDAARRLTLRQGSADAREEVTDQEGVVMPGDGNEASEYQQAGNPHGNGKGGGDKAAPGDTPRPGPDLVPGEEPGKLANALPGTEKKRRAMFSIEYRNETSEAKRSRYDADARLIVINLDHPQISGAYRASNGNIEARHFREICYEVAAVEYAQALPYERLERDGEFYTTADALYDVRDTINRITRLFAGALT